MKHHSKRNTVGAWLNAFLLVLCVIWMTPRLMAEPPPAKHAVHRGSSDSGIYLLAVNDLVDIKVFQEDDLQSTQRISKDGSIMFPYVGTVKIAGKSPQQAARLIQEGLAKSALVDPQVVVTVREYNKRRFTVLGEVQRPGAYDMPDRESVNLLEAIGMAGGYTRIAQPAKVTLKRVLNGKETIFKLNAKRMAKDASSGTFELRHGDVVTVAERWF